MINQFARDAVVAAAGALAVAFLTNLNTLWATFKTTKTKETEIAAKTQADLMDDGSEIRKEYRQLWLDTQTHNERLETMVGRLTFRNTQLEEICKLNGITIPPERIELPGPPG